MQKFLGSTLGRKEVYTGRYYYVYSLIISCVALGIKIQEIVLKNIYQFSGYIKEGKANK